YSVTGSLVRKITRETGLLNDCIYALLPVDKQAAVFASSNLGLSYVTAEGELKNFSKETGLQESEFNSSSCFKTINSRYYFGGVNGISAFYPSAFSRIIDTPVLHITRLVINDSLYNSSDRIWRGDSVLLNYHQNHLRIDVAALGLLNANEYLYKYRLLKIENTWQSTSQPTGINYTLEPGSYTLEIMCSPLLSSESIFYKKFVFIIDPPWWQTWWFRIGAFILAVAIIAFFIQQYNRGIYQRKIRALQMQQEIQQERERISRDLHDNLGAYAASIASNLDHISISGTDINNQVALHELRNNSQSIVSQLNDTIWALKKDALSLIAISDRLKVFIQKIQSSYPGIRIDVMEHITTDHLLPPSQAFHLFQIIQEAINNAVRHSGGKQVTVNIESNHQWEISIGDDGKGMSEQSSNTGGGNGVFNMKARAKETGWNIEWKRNEPRGTLVVIRPTTN
ncbi:MAG: ATP-binding protein, partial [Bacteroidota bacterium]|nr:ATP-binding protein [Bacteroidota bacterium]